MPNRSLESRKGGALSGRNYEKEILSFLERLILETNNFSKENHDYHLKEVKTIYDETLDLTREKVGRVPTLNELTSSITHFNYSIIWELANHDFKNGLGPLGIRDQLDFDHRKVSDEEYINEIYNAWAEHYSFQIGFGVDRYFSKLLCELKLCYIDDFNFHYKRTDTLDMCLYINDCQILLFPEWHYESIAKHYESESEEYIMSMRLVDEKLHYIDLGEDE